MKTVETNGTNICRRGDVDSDDPTSDIQISRNFRNIIDDDLYSKYEHYSKINITQSAQLAPITVHPYIFHNTENELSPEPTSLDINSVSNILNIFATDDKTNFHSPITQQQLSKNTSLLDADNSICIYVTSNVDMIYGE